MEYPERFEISQRAIYSAVTTRYRSRFLRSVCLRSRGSLRVFGRFMAGYHAITVSGRAERDQVEAPLPSSRG